ncbi:Crp/Fnr family transcriptional regulator [Gloeobacter kilaueensis]|uniref:Crp/Fnr family transcriptional regulator n=1 Tax=Gloeobacter kilaueensis (strain ATCC BAA-2537 / CCAP 1431/1 / ULC 316 / JS1) TaxID=1183438 RepID=U5QRD2_GLOK1|nr:Crp/Fnr family transcriptional regulator [Gloeobacter kilaueensis]AGY60275.1 Crp/Fnr family transcriptional regulator [Gloeobacter kilaueensis JS1]
MVASLSINASLLEAFAAEERKHLQSSAQKIALRPGEAVATEGGRPLVYMVESGAFVERSYYGARTVPIVHIAGPGDLLQTNRLFATSGLYRSELRAIHLENNSLLAWPVDEFLAIVRTSPGSLLYLCGWFNQQSQASRQQLYEAVAHSAYYRLVNLLVGLANRFGYRNTNGSTVLLPLRLTVKDISECINVSRETGSSLFNKLRRRGVIGAGRFIKVELSRLSEYAATLE